MTKRASRLGRKPRLIILIVALATFGSLFEARPIVRRYLEKQETCSRLRNGSPVQRLIVFTNPASVNPELTQATYHIDASGYCYHAECDLDLREIPEELNGWLEPKMKCRGDKMIFDTTEWSVGGFMVPMAIETLHVRVFRNGSKIYDDTVGRHPCPYGFCLVDAWH